MKIGELAHRMEDVLALVRSRNIVATPDRAGVLPRGNDRLHELIHLHVRGSSATRPRPAVALEESK